MKLVIFESPEKAKNVKEFVKELGWNDIKTAASYGHFRELAETGDNKVGILDWNEILIDWKISESKQKTVDILISLAKQADEIILATDGDREGEVIAWHLTEILKPYYKPPKSFKRIRLDSITKNEFERKMNNPDVLNQNMVYSGLSRAIIDKVIGYYLSPKVWSSTKGNSAGRVQSVILKLIVERYNENKSFKKKKSYKIITDSFAETEVFEEYPSNLVDVYNTKGINLQFLDKTIKNKTQSNFKPFDTLSAGVTISNIMKRDDVAPLLQKLYNNGYITYIRTDSKRLSDDVKDYLIENVKKLSGLDYLEPQTKLDASAQNAHPAITPATWLTKKPNSMSLQEWLVYQIIYQNTLLSVTKGADYCNVKIKYKDKNTQTNFELSKNFLINKNNLSLIDEFEKYNLENFKTTFWSETKWDKYSPEKVEELVNKINFSNNEWSLKEIESKPKPLFTLNTLKEEMKKLDIARPSTRDSAAIINVEKGFVSKNKNSLIPTEKGISVNTFLEKTEPVLIRIDFTKELEQTLDEVESGEYDWKSLVKEIRDIAMR